MTVADVAAALAASLGVSGAEGKPDKPEGTVTVSFSATLVRHMLDAVNAHIDIPRKHQSFEYGPEAFRSGEKEGLNR